jgi:DNA ligase (NAD+)
MYIRGLGDSVIEQLVDSQLVAEPADLYKLTCEELCRLDRMGEKSANKLLARIEDSKGWGFARLLYAVCIRHVGRNVANHIAGRYGTISELRKAKDLSIFGPAVALSVVSYLQNETELARLEVVLRND